MIPCTDSNVLSHLADRSRIVGCDNPSYSCGGPISSQTGKKSEYDNVQARHNTAMTSGGANMDTVNFDPNPAYSVGQAVKLEENPSYNKTTTVTIYYIVTATELSFNKLCSNMCKVLLCP